MRKIFLVGASMMVAFVLMGTGCNFFTNASIEDVIEGADTGKSYSTDALFSFFKEQLHKSVEKHTDYNTHPRLIELGDVDWVVQKNEVWNWTVGFYPGILWYMYEVSGDDFWMDEAIKRTLPLEPFKNNIYHHDVGFMMYCSYGNGYRLTHNPEYKEVLIQSAKSAISRYNPNVGTIRSWNIQQHPEWNQHVTIIDNMMNLELLFWATNETGDPVYREIAITHAETTMANHFRDDYSVYHVVEYDSISGAPLNHHTKQGFAHESLWARGQAWAIYGYTLMYRETGDEKYLDFVKRVIDRFLVGLPDDFIPYWDYDVAGREGEPRDASAAAIVASALVELYTLIGDQPEAEKYLVLADNILSSLGNEPYLTKGKSDAFLMHSTGAKPQGYEIDVALIYADYYFLEAVIRRAAINQR